MNERASEVDREYFAATNVVGAYNMYYAHNLHFVAYARSMQGRRADTVKAAKDLAEAVAPLAEIMPEMADAFLSVPQLLLTRVQAWDEILKAAAAGGEVRGADRDLAVRAHDGVVGQGRSGGRGAGAGCVRGGAEEGAGGSSVGQQYLRRRDGDGLGDRGGADRRTSVAHWEKAVALQDALVYDEPPAWNYPLRESLGAALVRAGRAADAEKVFREGLRRSPRNAWMIFGLMEAMKAQGKTEGLAELQHELDAAWGKADVKLTLAAM